MEKQMQTVNVNDYSFHYVEEGSGEPLLLVHGSASDLRTWQAQVEAFSRHFRTLAYSRRYHLPNDPIGEGADYAMSEHVADLEAVIRALDSGPMHLVGHSYGAFICLLLAVRSPALVHSLVLAEPPAITLFVSNQPKPAEIMKLLVSRPSTAVEIIKFGSKGVAPAVTALKEGDEAKALDIFGAATLGQDAYQSLSETRLTQARDNFIKAELLGSGFSRLDQEQLRHIEIPTLLLSGQKSPRLFGRLLDRLEELLPQTERVVIPAAAHIMHEDNAPVFNAAVLSFLAKKPIPPNVDLPKQHRPAG